MEPASRRSQTSCGAGLCAGSGDPAVCTAAAHVGRVEIEAAAATLGIRRAYVYRLLAAYRRRPQTSTLVPKHRGRPQTARLLDTKAEAVIQAAITGFYLTRERPRFSDLMRDIEARCHVEAVHAPDYRTVRRRLKTSTSRSDCGPPWRKTGPRDFRCPRCHSNGLANRSA